MAVPQGTVGGLTHTGITGAVWFAGKFESILNIDYLTYIYGNIAGCGMPTGKALWNNGAREKLSIQI